MSRTRAIRLAGIPAGGPDLSLFEFTDQAVSEPASGELTIRVLLISVDPYLVMPIRAGGFPEGRIRSRVIAQVEQSRAEGFMPGDLVLGFARWQERDTVPASEMRKIDPVLPLTAYLGIAGHSGYTALIGMDILAPKPGQTITISSAAGMVGMVAAQMAKASGARVVVIAGGEKPHVLVERFGFDAGVDHTAPDFTSLLAAACPDGIDRHFENVGAKILDPVMALANKHARIALCGLIQHYQDDAPICFANFRRVLHQSISIMPFSIYDHDADYPAGLARLEAMVQQGHLGAPETIHDGFSAVPSAFLAMLSGKGIGKHLVRIADARPSQV